MKKMMIMMLALMACGMTANAQIMKKETGKGQLKEQVARFWDQTKKVAGDVASQIEAEFSTDNSVLRRIEGKYYMNIYDINLYKGGDAAGMLDLCRSQFAAKYPSVPITSCVIPQTDWVSETVETNGQVTGYTQTLFCYIIGKDGNAGYINAKFVFERSKAVGEEPVNNSQKWALWIRTDILTQHVYDRLKNNK